MAALNQCQSAGQRLYSCIVVQVPGGRGAARAAAGVPRGRAAAVRERRAARAAPPSAVAALGMILYFSYSYLYT